MIMVIKWSRVYCTERQDILKIMIDILIQKQAIKGLAWGYGNRGSKRVSRDRSRSQEAQTKR